MFRHRLVVRQITRCYCMVGEVQPNEDIATKILRVSIIGSPNAGKSTLINALVGHRVCPVSSKVHTTRSNIQASFTENDTQVVFYDTPGVVTNVEVKKHHLEESFVKGAEETIHTVNLLGIVHDVSNKYTRHKLDTKVMDLLLAAPKRRSILILNKVDKLKKKDNLLHVIKSLTEYDVTGSENQPRGRWNKFSEIFMVSALTGEGTSAVLQYLLNEAKPGHWRFTPGQHSNQPTHIAIKDAVKARLLDNLNQEVPYLINVEVEYLHENELGELVSVVLIHCPSGRYEKMLLKRKGEMIKKIAQFSENDLRDAFQTNVRCRLIVVTEQKKKKFNLA